MLMAIGGDAQPHYSTLASFVSSLGEALSKVFTQVLMICDRQGLIGRQMFAVDGMKLPSNASKAKSGKRKDFVRQAAKMEQAVEKILSRHRDNDAAGAEVLDFTGEMTVLDACKLGSALTQGIGHAKAFGCGLLLVRRVG
jgi:hypothetical protein